MLHISLFKLTFKSFSVWTMDCVNVDVKSGMFSMETMACGNHLIMTSGKCIASFDLQDA